MHKYVPSKYLKPSYIPDFKIHIRYFDREYLLDLVKDSNKKKEKYDYKLTFFYFLYLQEIPLRQGSSIAKVWADPPITPYLKLYFFNVTNHEEFRNGSKPVFEEIGPFTYS